MLYPNFKKFIAEGGLVTEGSAVVLSVSGGVDSMVMMDLVSRLARPMKLSVTVAHVNHRLRGRNSDADEELVRHAAEAYDFDFMLKRARPPKGRNLQDAARRIRMEFLNRAAGKCGATCVLIAHNRGDQAETMLMHLIRGAGLEGLAGMRSSAMAGSVKIVRPLLFAARGEIERYARERGIEFRQDESNLTDRYRRNDIRLKLIPMLTRFNPRIEEGLADMCERLACENDVLALIAETGFHDALSDESEGRVALARDAYSEMPRAIRIRMLKMAWERAAGGRADLNSDQLGRMDQVALAEKPSGEYRLKAPFEFVRHGDVIEIGRRPSRGRRH